MGSNPTSDASANGALYYRVSAEFATSCHHMGGKYEKSHSVFKGLRALTLKENLCKNNVAINHHGTIVNL